MLLLGSSGTGSHGGEIAKAVDFDGTNDYLSRASDLVGNADGKTFTFSAWVWSNLNSDGNFYNSSSKFRINVTPSNLQISAQDVAANPIIVFSSGDFKSLAEIGTFYHVLISVDLANTSKRYVYINDVPITGGTWGTYTNANIDFTNAVHGVGENYKGRLAHVFLAYEYIDLSVEANRRIFITSDRKPSTSASASWIAAGKTAPILYFPLSDPTAPGKNLGTGGDFALTGVVARSGRGPNQFNVAYSDLDGANDYVNITGPLLPGGSKTLTFSCAFNTDTTGDQYLFGFWTSVSVIAQIFGVYIGSGGTIGVYALNSSGATILDAYSTAGTVVVGRNYTLSIAIDLTNSAHRQVSLNGNPLSLTWATYTNDYIFFNQASNSPITSAGRCRSFYFNGRLGDVWFDTSYIDLSIPANLAKFVTGTGIDAKPVDLGANGELPLGVQPLIYLPMYGNNAGKNYGTGGDFTVNSGPYTGARGPNEFWGNKADFDGSTGWLKKSTQLTGLVDSKTVSMSFWFSPDGSGGNMEWFNFSITATATTYRFVVSRNSSNQIRIIARTTAGTTILDVTTASTGFTAASSNYVQLSFDLANSSNRSIYVNGNVDSSTWTTYSNTSIPFSSTDICRIGASNTGSELDGKLSEFYFTTDYIDFSQEANRLKFRDAFGNPVDLRPQITAGTLPNPAIYMRFDPADQGKNSGTGGNFTKSGTINDGGQL